jgi:hypothetical protein
MRILICDICKKPVTNLYQLPKSFSIGGVEESCNSCRKLLDTRNDKILTIVRAQMQKYIQQLQKDFSEDTNE